MQVRGKFQTDSIKIGIVFNYSLTATYPREETILFPDSTFSFDPFEIHHKIYFPTRTTNSYSYDSVVYYLTSFEIDSVQKLSLPVFVVHPKDCTAIFASIDSVVLKQMVKHVPDSISAKELPLKTNTAYQAVSWLLNYPLLLIIGGILLIATIVVWIVFGKSIKRYLALRKLTKSHHKFIHEFSVAIDRLQSSYSISHAEAALLLWKKYMEKLLAAPYTKFTTKEIFQQVKDEQLAKALKKIDRNIYGDGIGLEKDPMLQLQQFSEQRFNEKVQEVKNG